MYFAFASIRPSYDLSSRICVRMVTFSSTLSAHRSDVPKCEGERLGELYTCGKCGRECARKLEARRMRIGRDAHHGFWEGGDGRSAGLRGRFLIGSGASAVGDGIGERGWLVGSPFTCKLDRGKLSRR
jgi:hypothetical protein